MLWPTIQMVLYKHRERKSYRASVGVEKGHTASLTRHSPSREPLSCHLLEGQQGAWRRTVISLHFQGANALAKAQHKCQVLRVPVRYFHIHVGEKNDYFTSLETMPFGGGGLWHTHRDCVFFYHIYLRVVGINFCSCCQLYCLESGLEHTKKKIFYCSSRKPAVMCLFPGSKYQEQMNANCEASRTFV